MKNKRNPHIPRVKETVVAEPTRTFGGKLTDFANKAERSFEQKHLKNYLKGAQYFRHGYKLTESGKKVPALYVVVEKWV